MELMPMPHVLIAYASKYGATKEMAERVAQVLRRNDVTVDVKEADTVSSLHPYDAVVLGSGVYFDNWLPEASELLESFQDELTSKPVWLFSSGLTAKVGPQQWLFPETLQPLVKKINPKAIALFGGKVVAEQLSLEDWLINPSLRVEEAGDYRNWHEIEAWARNIAKALQTEKVTIHS
jgi:menaquinone-dependent protoporphyrinogen oxidase